MLVSQVEMVLRLMAQILNLGVFGSGSASQVVIGGQENTMPTAIEASLHQEFLRLDYMSRNPPAKPLCSTPTILSDGEGSVIMQHGDIVDGLVCYRNPSGGYGDNLYNPVKHSFTGWLSPCGFLLSTPAGQNYAHSTLAASICERLGLEGDPECELEDAGWLRLLRSQIVGPFDPNEVQAGILCHLCGL